MTILLAPLPNLGTCTDTGKFPENQVASCQACIKKNDDPLTEPGTKYFFCRNKCYNSYAADGYGCDYADLVAKNLDQCSNPCKQVALPAAHPQCSDNFDCSSNETCQNGYCKKSKASASRNISSSESSQVAPSTSSSTPLLFLIIFSFILIFIFFFIRNT